MVFPLAIAVKLAVVESEEDGVVGKEAKEREREEGVRELAYNVNVPHVAVLCRKQTLFRFHENRVYS